MRRQTMWQPYIRRWACLAYACFLVLVAWSQASPRAAEPADFVRLYDVAGLADGDVLLIGAVYEQKQQFWLMTSVPLKNKMKAVLMGADTPTTLSCSDETQMWYYREGADGRFALESSEGKYLYEVKSTDITLSTTKTPVWSVESTPDGTFHISHKSTPERYIGFYYTVASGKPAPYFGNYLPNGSDSYDLYVYRKKRADEYYGSATMPESGSSVTLFARGVAAASSGSGNALSSLSTDSCELFNGLLAPDTRMAVWRCRYGTTANTFRLCFSDDTYLGDGLQRTGTPFDWRISDGFIVPAMPQGGGETEDNAERRIYYKPSGQQFCMLTDDEALQCGAVSVKFREVGESPFSDYDANTRKKTLTGAWTANLLRTIGWSGVGTLDLRLQSMPLLATGFAYRPQGCNVPIYVNAGESEDIPAAWDFVVNTVADERMLLRETTLSDKTPFLPVYEFTATEGMLCYEREAFADGNWETVCLPFDASVPQGFEAEVLTEMNGDELIFSPAEVLEAYVPAIIRYVGGQSSGTVKLACYSKAGLVEKPRYGQPFTGVFDTLQVADAAEAIYLLEESGTKFVRAASGSKLMPFRAYIQLSGEKIDEFQTFNVLHAAEIAAGIGDSAIMPSNQMKGACYDLHGRKVADRLTKETWKMLPPGIYIIGGQKYIK